MIEEKKGINCILNLNLSILFPFRPRMNFKEYFGAENIQRTRQDIYVVLNKHSKDWINIKFSVSLELRLNCFSVMSELFFTIFLGLNMLIRNRNHYVVSDHLVCQQLKLKKKLVREVLMIIALQIQCPRQHCKPSNPSI